MSRALFFVLIAVCAFSQKPDFPSSGLFHPGCSITNIFEEDCSSLVYFLEDEYSLYRPGPNGFYYYMLSNTMDNNGTSYLRGNVTNPGSWYNFNTLVTLAQNDDLCTVVATSQSQTFSYYDGYANYCNEFLLFRGFNSLQTTVTDCKWQPKDASICTKT